MIGILLFSVAILLPSILGYMLWELVQADKERDPWESVSFAFPFGAGAIVVWMLFLANLGVQLTRTVLLVPPAAAVLILLIFRKRLAPRPAPAPVSSIFATTSEGSRWACGAFLAIVGIEFFCTAVPLLRLPQITEWDGWAIWEMKAKAIFVDRGFGSYLSRAAEYNFSWPARPCFTSAFQAFVHIVSGNLNEAAARCVHVILYASLMLIFYVTLRRRLEAWIAIAWTAMLATIPNLAYWANAGLANLPLGIFLFSAVIALDRWRSENSAGYLAASSAFFGFALLTRDEAVGLVAICLVVAVMSALRQPVLSRRLILFLASLLIAGSALIYSLWAWLVRAYPMFDLRSVWLTPEIFQRVRAHLPDLGAVLKKIAAELMKPPDQALASPFETKIGISLFWPLFALALILSGFRAIIGLRKSGSQDELMMKCGICATLGLCAYSLGLWLFPYWSMNDLAPWSNALDRQVMSLVPMAAYHLALAFSVNRTAPL
jgi:hypothetical protein